MNELFTLIVAITIMGLGLSLVIGKLPGGKIYLGWINKGLRAARRGAKRLAIRILIQIGREVESLAHRYPATIGFVTLCLLIATSYLLFGAH